MTQLVIVKTRHPAQSALVVLLFAWGASAVIAQSVLLRETTVLFFAGEISWGIMLFAWLAGVGLGAWLGGWLSRRVARADRWLALVVAVFALAGPVFIVLLRGARGWLEVGPGQYILLEQMIWLSGLLVSPFGLLIGVAFPLACVAARGPDDALRIGRVYFVESAGSLVGGLAFTFMLVGQVGATVLLALCGSALMATASVWLAIGKPQASDHEACATNGRPSTRNRHDRNLIPATLTGTLACGLFVAALHAGGQVERWSIQRRWQSFAAGMELRESVESRYQNLALGWRDGQFGLYANGHPTTTFPEPTAMRWPGQMSLCQHPDPQRILLLGGSFEGMLAETLTHRCVQRVDVVELDPAILRLVRQHLPASDRQALDDDRVTVVHQDVRRFVKQASGPYDLVVGQFGPPASAMVARFYTADFYRDLSSVMSRDGVLAFQTETSPAELRPRSAACTGTIRRTLEEAFDDVIVGWGPNPWVLACKKPGVLTTDLDELGKRLVGRGVPESHFAPEDFAMNDQLDAELVAKRRAELRSLQDTAVSTDFHPAIYLLWLQRWEQQMLGRPTRGLSDADESGETSTVGSFGRLARISPPVLAGALAIPVLAWLAWRTVRHGRRRGLAGGIVLASLASTGLVTMSAEIVILFAYQSLRGLVYEQIGAAIALFMLGLCLGSGAMNRLLSRRTIGRGCLVSIDVLLAALVLAIPTSLAAVDRGDHSWGILIVVFGGLVAMGVLGGMAFPLAARLHGTLDGHAGLTAGAVDSSDHLGACLGALLAGTILVPGLGIHLTCLGLAGIKVLSGIALLLGTPRDVEQQAGDFP